MTAATKAGATGTIKGREKPIPKTVSTDLTPAPALYEGTLTDEQNAAILLQPVATVRWIHRSYLHANNYNPNHVPPPELDLLALSILEDGWTQPIVARTDGEIVDGFHRWTVSERPAIADRTGGFVPVVFLSAEKSLADQMMATIRHNRARGNHGVVPMAHIVRELQEKHGLDSQALERRLGMEDEEVARLSDRAGLPTKVTRDTTQQFGSGWVPQGGKI